MKSGFILFFLGGMVGLLAGVYAGNQINQEEKISPAAVAEMGEDLRQIKLSMEKLDKVTQLVKMDSDGQGQSDKETSLSEFSLLLQIDRLLEKNRKEIEKGFLETIDEKTQQVARAQPVKQEKTQAKLQNISGESCATGTQTQQAMFRDMKKQLHKTDFSRYQTFDQYLKSVGFEKLTQQQQQQFIDEVVRLSGKGQIPEELLMAEPES